MKKIIPIVLLGILLSGCSIVDKQVYYTPEVEAPYKTGPQEPLCGFNNFGGLPDKYLAEKNKISLSVTAYQNDHPYLWGPWFVSVIPVFPITWIAEAFVTDALDIEVSFKEKSFDDNEQIIFSVYLEDDNEMIMPVKVVPYSWNGYTNFSIKFPLEYDSIDKFVFNIKSNIKDMENIEIPFKKTSRWSWTQVTPNC